MHYDDTALDAEFELPKFIEDLKKTNISLGSDKKKFIILSIINIRT